MNNINHFFEKYYELKECNIEKIFMTSILYLDLLEHSGGIKKENNNYSMGKTNNLLE